MNENEKTLLLNLVKDRPQELCKMCGNCCRVVTTKDSYEELLNKQSEGDKGAIDFLNIFVPFESIDDARKESDEIVENILKRIDKTDKKITFYKCKYLQDDNKCGDYEHRPLLCRLNPFSAWSIVPPNCGFNDWLKEQKAKKMSEINHQKEVLEELGLLLRLAKNSAQIDEINKRIEKTKEIINYYKEGGF